MTHLVLGSASTGRLSVLRNAGIEPVVLISGVDEDAVLAAYPDASPAQAVAALAAAKADAVVANLPAELAADAVVIGCDSMLLHDGRLCGKPGTPDRVREHWAQIAGSSGDLLTGHCLVRLHNGAVSHQIFETASTTVYFGNPTADELEAYIASGEPLHVAGGFTLDGLGGWWVDSIEGDPSNVIGISLPLLERMLKQVGLSSTQLWNAPN